MTDKFAKRPTVKRFGLKKTYAGRTVKRTTVTKRNIKSLKKGRPMRPMKPMRKGR